VLNRDCPCTKDRDSCKNRYPRPFCDVIVQGKDSYLVYRRREHGQKEKVHGHELDNKWVVPYNSYLFRLFNCHIKVEACGSIKAVKYLFKYIYKGHDRSVVAVREADKDKNGNGVGSDRVECLGTQNQNLNPPRTPIRVEIHP
jgi:hypothetical protein